MSMIAIALFLNATSTNANAANTRISTHSATTLQQIWRARIALRTIRTLDIVTITKYIDKILIIHHEPSDPVIGGAGDRRKWKMKTCKGNASETFSEKAKIPFKISSYSLVNLSPAPLMTGSEGSWIHGAFEAVKTKVCSINCHVQFNSKSTAVYDVV